jgi:hypothetical protein
LTLNVAIDHTSFNYNVGRGEHVVKETFSYEKRLETKRIVHHMTERIKKRSKESETAQLDKVINPIIAIPGGKFIFLI